MKYSNKPTVCSDFPTRKSATVDWDNINCSTMQNITQEDSDLSLQQSDLDSVSKTFNASTVHTSISVGSRTLGGCYAIRTFNGTGEQSESTNADFQEVILSDGADNVYATILEQNASGFDNNDYDFQLLLPEATSGAANTYYFYMELS